MKLVKWFDKEETKKAESYIKQFVEKFDAGTLDATTDNLLFYLAMAEATLESQETDDEDKAELWEEMVNDMEEKGNLAYFTSIRGVEGQNIVQVLKPEEQLFGLWEGEFDYTQAEKIAPGVKNIIYMDMVPATATKIIKGNANTDSDYFKGDLTVLGTINLAVKPRNWISLFFEFIDREPEE